MQAQVKNQDSKVNETKPSTDLNASSAEKLEESITSADILNPIDSLISSSKDLLQDQGEKPMNQMFGGMGAGLGGAGGGMFGGVNPFQNLSQQYTQI